MTRDPDEIELGAIAIDYLGAIALALEGAGSNEAAITVVRHLVDEGPKPNGDATMPTHLLIRAIRTVGGEFTVRV
jgi:hypothetical protein